MCFFFLLFALTHNFPQARYRAWVLPTMQLILAPPFSLASKRGASCSPLSPSCLVAFEMALIHSSVPLCAKWTQRTDIHPPRKPFPLLFSCPLSHHPRSPYLCAYRRCRCCHRSNPDRVNRARQGLNQRRPPWRFRIDGRFHREAAPPLGMQHPFPSSPHNSIAKRKIPWGVYPSLVHSNLLDRRQSPGG